MKIVVLNCSPRSKSNTMNITNAFLDGIKEKVPETEIEVLDLKKLDIRPCRGCFTCWGKTPGVCVINDDMRNIVLPKCLEADVLIWSSPLYYYSLPSVAKACMDRQLPTSMPYMEDDGAGHPGRYKKKVDVVLISTCGFHDTSVFGPMDAMFKTIYGEFTSIYRAEGELFRPGEERPEALPILESIRQCGREYAVDGKISEDTMKGAKKQVYDLKRFTSGANTYWDNVIDGNTDKK